MISVNTNQIMKDYSFIDFMFGGTDLNFIVAIDLTSSNGDIHDPTSLHFIDENSSNEYSVAIQAVLEILQEYDNDELFPAFGFGARVAPDFKICHEYPLTGDFSNPFCQGVEGVIHAYHETLQNIELSGPTYFAPVIRQVINLAKQYCDGSHYFVLLILTDGTVDDWIETKKAVIEASFLPISIIVVGVGGGKFLDMKTLDQDFGLLKVGNDEACRDNVQFVPMRKFLRLAADGSDNVKWSKVALAKEVLAELPDQLLGYMKKHNLKPVMDIRACDLFPSEDLMVHGKDLTQQKLRRCATAYGMMKTNNKKGLNGRGIRGIRKCSVDSQFLDELDRSTLHPRSIFSEPHG